jgi:condensin complex subunit 1
VKGHVAEVGVCLHDPEPRVAALAEWFFLELSKRGNTVFNLLPDMLSHLSMISSKVHEGGSPLALFGQSAFRGAMKFLLGLLDKDKHTDSLAEKFIQRLHSSGGASVGLESETSSSTGGVDYGRALWRDVAYCL